MPVSLKDQGWAFHYYGDGGNRTLVQENIRTSFSERSLFRLFPE